MTSDFILSPFLNFEKAWALVFLYHTLCLVDLYYYTGTILPFRFTLKQSTFFLGKQNLFFHFLCSSKPIHVSLQLTRILRQNFWLIYLYYLYDGKIICHSIMQTPAANSKMKLSLFLLYLLHLRETHNALTVISKTLAL